MVAFKDISVKEAKDMLNEDIVILDVRTPEEFKEEHIEEAININCYDNDFEERINMLDKNKKYLVYCGSGGRSKNTAFLMEELGFKDINNMVGGFAAWEENGKPIE